MRPTRSHGKSAELQPAAAATHRWQALIAAQRGDGETALREAQLEPDEGYRRFELALAHYVRGDRAGGRRGFSRSHRQRSGSIWPIKSLRFTRCEARTDKAFEWLQISFDNHDTGTLTLLTDPLLRGLRDDPRYKNFLAKLGLPGSS